MGHHQLIYKDLFFRILPFDISQTHGIVGVAAEIFRPRSYCCRVFVCARSLIGFVRQHNLIDDVTLVQLDLSFRRVPLTRFTIAICMRLYSLFYVQFHLPFHSVSSYATSILVPSIIFAMSRRCDSFPASPNPDLCLLASPFCLEPQQTTLVWACSRNSCAHVEFGGCVWCGAWGSWSALTSANFYRCGFGPGQRALMDVLNVWFISHFFFLFFFFFNSKPRLSLQCPFPNFSAMLKSPFVVICLKHGGVAFHATSASYIKKKWIF